MGSKPLGSSSNLTPTSWRHFHIIFVQRKPLCYVWNSTLHFLLKVSIGSGRGFAPNSRQAIICIGIDQDSGRHYGITKPQCVNQLPVKYQSNKIYYIYQAVVVLTNVLVMSKLRRLSDYDDVRWKFSSSVDDFVIKRKTVVHVTKRYVPVSRIRSWTKKYDWLSRAPRCEGVLFLSRKLWNKLCSRGV